MKTLRIPSRVALFVGAIVLVLQISPALAGARAEAEGDNYGGPVEITFTKWITTAPPCPCLMAGFTGGDVPGVFSGEVLQRQVSLNNHVIRLDAMYEVQDEDQSDGDQSFTALIRGGQSPLAGGTGVGLLDGVIQAGWRTGTRVHVEYQAMTACAGAPPGTCFQGTIQVEHAPEK